MKVDLHDSSLVSTVTLNRKVLSPSFSCPLKISLRLHLQTSKVIFRCASVALADPRTTLPSSLLSIWLPCQEKKRRNSACCKALSILSFNCSYSHKHVYTLACMDTYTPSHTHSCTGICQLSRWKSTSPNMNKVFESSHTDVWCWPLVIMDEE